METIHSMMLRNESLAAQVWERTGWTCDTSGWRGCIFCHGSVLLRHNAYQWNKAKTVLREAFIACSKWLVMQNARCCLNIVKSSVKCCDKFRENDVSKCLQKPLEDRDWNKIVTFLLKAELGPDLSKPQEITHLIRKPMGGLGRERRAS